MYSQALTYSQGLTYSQALMYSQAMDITLPKADAQTRVDIPQLYASILMYFRTEHIHFSRA